MTDPLNTNNIFKPSTGFVPLFSLLKLEKMAGGSKDFVERMVKVFVVEMPLSVAELKGCLLNNDFEQMSQIAHRIKPTIETMDIHSLKDAIKELEQIAKHEPGSPRIKPLIVLIERDILEVTDLLKMMFSHCLG